MEQAGKDNNGNWIQGASAANIYDNRLELPTIIDTARGVYVGYIDESGNFLEMTPNDSQNIVSGGTKKNSGKRNGYQEYYSLNKGEALNVHNIAIGNYEFIGSKKASGADFNTATKALNNAIYGKSTNLKTDSNQAVTIILFKYKKAGGSKIPQVELEGEVDFYSDEYNYQDSTSSMAPNIDYIPSGQRLIPYINNAYPYLLRGLNYEKKTITKNVTGNILVESPYSGYYTYQVFDHNECRQCEVDIGNETKHIFQEAVPGDPENGIPPIKEISHTGYRKVYRTETDSISGKFNKSFSYPLSYTKIYNQLNNFKIYQIDQAKLIDESQNDGGVLFNGGTYNLQLSNSYYNRFNYGIRNTRDEYFTRNGSQASSNEIYELDNYSEDYCTYPDQYKSTPTREYSESYLRRRLENQARIELNKVTRYSAASDIGYGYRNICSNDGVTIEGSDIILNANEKTEEINLSNQNRVIVDTTDSYTENARNFIEPNNRTGKSDFVANSIEIPSNRVNGIRDLKATITYKIKADGSFNRGGNNFIDKTLYGYNASITSDELANHGKMYKGKNEVTPVNVFTPVAIGEARVETQGIIDQNGSINSSIIQKNVPFTIRPTSTMNSDYRGIDTEKFIDSYVIEFDFKLEKYTIYYANGQVYSSGGVTESWDKLRIPKGGYVKALAYAKLNEENNIDQDIIGQLENTYRVYAVAINSPEALKRELENQRSSLYSGPYIDPMQNTLNTDSYQKNGEFYNGIPNISNTSSLLGDSNYMSIRTFVTKNIGRIYDFRVTDCTDINFKDVFRKVDLTGTHSKYAYYSGRTYWDMYSTLSNSLVVRPASEIGTSPLRILPFGPYKHTDKTYVAAPKIGYKISFDLKTTGKLANVSDRQIEIVPTYYYLSKDGKNYTKDVDLYYKNGSGNYINLETNPYEFYFKPNDGYRYTRNQVITKDISNMSNKLERQVTNKLVLDSKMMSIDEAKFVQVWYGEFKLPNSTLVVSKGEKDLNKSLRDGYIGVKFNIVSKDKNGGYDLSYNRNTSSINTSQWDFESYLGFRRYGNEVLQSDKLRLFIEKGSFDVNSQEQYQNIKSTVVLFDLDNRAATDFE